MIDNLIIMYNKYDFKIDLYIKLFIKLMFYQSNNYNNIARKFTIISKIKFQCFIKTTKTFKG